MRRVYVSGSTGFLGEALVERFARDGVQIGCFVRSATERPNTVRWSVEAGIADPKPLEGIDAVVHLAGPNLAASRWTAARKRELREARVRGTEGIARALAALSSPPAVLVAASAVGYYGDRGDELLDEESNAGSGFLADLCGAWEAATSPARQAGVRVVHARLGVVLAPGGGALARMIPPFRVGLGGRLGDGRQYLSWISRNDAVEAIRFAIDTPELSGPVNLTAPEPVRNAEFTRALGRALRRPAVLPVPAFVLRLALGEMADEALLASQRVRPRRLEEGGFSFRDAELGAFLARELG